MFDAFLGLKYKPLVDKVKVRHFALKVGDCVLSLVEDGILLALLFVFLVGTTLPLFLVSSVFGQQTIDRVGVDKGGAGLFRLLLFRLSFLLLLLSHLAEDLRSHVLQVARVRERLRIVEVHRFFDRMQQLIRLHELTAPDAHIAHFVLAEDSLHPVLQVLWYSVHRQVDRRDLSIFLELTVLEALLVHTEHRVCQYFVHCDLFHLFLLLLCQLGLAHFVHFPHAVSHAAFSAGHAAREVARLT